MKPHLSFNLCCCGLGFFWCMEMQKNHASVLKPCFSFEYIAETWIQSSWHIASNTCCWCPSPNRNFSDFFPHCWETPGSDTETLLMLISPRIFYNFSWNFAGWPPSQVAFPEGTVECCWLYAGSAAVVAKFLLCWTSWSKLLRLKFYFWMLLFKVGRDVN